MVNLNDDIKLVDLSTRTIYLNTGGRFGFSN